MSKRSKTVQRQPKTPPLSKPELLARTRQAQRVHDGEVRGREVETVQEQLAATLARHGVTPRQSGAADHDRVVAPSMAVAAAEDPYADVPPPDEPADIEPPVTTSVTPGEPRDGVPADVPPIVHLRPGGTFIFDEPERTPALWGIGDQIAWPEGESLILAGGQGVGKTTLAGNLVAGLIGDTVVDVLALPVQPVRRVLYLAMDRPRQAARSLRRQLARYGREHLDERLSFMAGPPPHDLARRPELLTAIAEHADVDVVVVDSLKDAAVGLSEDEVGAGWNRARQKLLASGRNILELHHIKKIPGDKKPDIGDVYGSTWITSGAGSVLLLNGAPGDPVIKVWHLKQPLAELGPWDVIHDHDGAMTVQGQVDLVQIARARAGVTAPSAARLMFDTSDPTRNQTEKARRRLDGLVRAGELARESSPQPGVPVLYTAVGAS